jgi:hypothetical protein
MVQGLRIFTVLVENLGLVSNTCMAIKATCKSSSRQSDALFWLLRLLHTYGAHILTKVHTQIIKLFFNL